MYLCTMGIIRRIPSGASLGGWIATGVQWFSGSALEVVAVDVDVDGLVGKGSLQMDCKWIGWGRLWEVGWQLVLGSVCVGREGSRRNTVDVDHRDGLVGKRAR